MGGGGGEKLDSLELQELNNILTVTWGGGGGGDLDSTKT